MQTFKRLKEFSLEISVANMDRIEFQIITSNVTCKPPFALWFLILCQPLFIPRMRKVHDQHELDQDEQEATDHAENHPNFLEFAMWNKHGTNKNPEKTKNLE